MRGGSLTPIHLLALSLVTLILFNRHRHKNANHENILCWAGEGIRVSALNPIASTRRSKFFDKKTGSNVRKVQDTVLEFRPVRGEEFANFSLNLFSSRFCADFIASLLKTKNLNAT